MNFLVFSFASFEKNYSSCHLYEAIISSMLKRGHSVTLFQKKYSATSKCLPDSLIGSGGLNVVGIPFTVAKGESLKRRYIADFHYVRKAIKLLRSMGKFDAALVQSHNAPGFTIARLNRLGIRCVYNEQDIFPLNALEAGLLQKGVVYSIAKKMVLSGYRKADRIITISEDMAGVIEQAGVQHYKLQIVHNWCRRNRNYLVSDDKNIFLKNFSSVLNGKYCVVYAGNIGRMQGVSTVISAAKMVDDADILFVVVGDGNEKSLLMKTTDELKLKNIVFIDSQPEEISQDIYAAADINLIPLLEGVTNTCMPSKTAACIHSRRPLIASVDPGTWAFDMFDSISFGMSVKAGDAAALANAILEFRNKYGSRYLADPDFNHELMFSEANAELYVDTLEKVTCEEESAR